MTGVGGPVRGVNILPDENRMILCLCLHCQLWASIGSYISSLVRHSSPLSRLWAPVRSYISSLVCHSFSLVRHFFSPQPAVGTYRVAAAEAVTNLLSANNISVGKAMAAAKLVPVIMHLALSHPLCSR